MLLRISLICSILVAGAIAVLPQSSRRPSRKPPVAVQPTAQPTPPATPEPAVEASPEPIPASSPIEEQQEAETLKIDTNLVMVPVIASTVGGDYIPDLRQEEFAVTEDGEKQEVAFFATVSAPFHVVLLLDTSASTREKLGAIQKAAVAFVEQLQRADRVKVISFDTELRQLSNFTSDRAALKDAIYKTVSGTGTRLYDAFELALTAMKPIQGRKAIVLFSDGVDWRSDNATYSGTLHWLDEADVIVYPIRFETRKETERIAREGANDTSQLPTIGVIRKSPPGGTAPTFPSDDSSSIPSSRQPQTGPLGLPTAGDIMRGRRQREPNPDQYPRSDRLPPTGGPGTNPGARSDPNFPMPLPGDDPGGSGPRRRGPSGDADTITVMLDEMYLQADSYLTQLANQTGGRMLRADSVNSLPDAFAKIAAELRTQYAVGYYSTNKTHDGSYRKIKIKTTRKNVVLRARPGYLAPKAD